MKWIKVSERLPEARKTYFVKTTRGKSVLSTNYYDAKRRKIVFIRINPDSSHTIVDNVIEWLDESEPQPQGEELEARLKEYGMSVNEYLLRKNYVDAINERDELRNQVKALSAVKKGLESSLSECLKGQSQPQGEQEGQDKGLQGLQVLAAKRYPLAEERQEELWEELHISVVKDLTDELLEAKKRIAELEKDLFEYDILTEYNSLVSNKKDDRIAELEKEVERLKGLVEKAFRACNIWEEGASVFVNMWEQFKQANNL